MFHLILRLWLVLSLMPLALAPASAPASAAETPAETAANTVDARVNLAGRQRMLTQRMAKASCFVMIGIAPEIHAAQSETAANEFEAALDALRFGDAALGFDAEHDAAVLATLARVDGMWQTYGPAIRQLYSRDYHKVVVEQFLRLDLAMLDQANETVGLIEALHTRATGPADRAATINVAGRQRMLSQKMAKELCLGTADIQGSAQRLSLKMSIAQFDRAMVLLETGNPDAGLIAPPDHKVRLALRATAREWAVLRPLLVRAVEGEPLTDAEVLFVAEQSNIVLRAAHLATISYL